MYEPEDNFSEDNFQLEKLKLEKIEDLDLEGLSPQNVAARQKQLERIFMRLIIFGLAFGVVVSIGTIYVLLKFNLARQTYEFEENLEPAIEQQEPTK